MGTKNNPAPYDCMANAEPDEPYFVLLARDPLAAELVLAWAILRRATVDEGPAQADEAAACAGAMERWRARNRADKPLTALLSTHHLYGRMSIGLTPLPPEPAG